jgi:FemAB-related protein (PEP-CTERM system-associated)
VLSVRPHTEADRLAWDHFVLGTDGSHPAQMSAWLALTERTYGVALRAWLAEEGGTVRGVLPLFKKRRFGRSAVLFSPPGGMLADNDAVSRALLTAAEEDRVERGAEYIELRDQHRRWPDLATSTEHCTHVLELAADAETQWHMFDAKLRNQIRKAQRAGFAVRWGAEHLSGFYRVMLENMRDLGTPLRAESWFLQVVDVLGERAAVLLIERGGEPVGAMVLALHRGCAMDLWASSLRRHFADCPNQMLYWEAIQEVIRRGLRTFDFGRSQWGTGTFRFKEQWGAQAVPLYYQYLLGDTPQIPNFAAQQHRMDLAVRIWKRLPLPVVRILGEPLRRRFPELV